MVQLSRTLEAQTPPDHVLATLAGSVAEALRSPYVLIRPIGEGAPLSSVEHGRRPSDRSRLVEVTLSHSGVSVGRLFVAPRRHEQFAPTDLRLLSDLALPTAAALYALMLSRDLRRSRERLVRTIEDERRRLGRELHDGLGPSLAAISMQAETAAALIYSDPHGAARVLSRLVDHTERVVEDTRHLAYTRRPPALDALGLVVALQSHLTHVTSIPVELAAADDLPHLPAAVEMAAYRIALEALNNVVAHADAHRCVLRITHDGERLTVEIEDDGRGILPGQRPGIGVDSMGMRAEELGGTLTLTTGRDGHGTMVRAVLPCDEPTTLADLRAVRPTNEQPAWRQRWPA
jgi:signal transduction histidine kinase